MRIGQRYLRRTRKRTKRSTRRPGTGQRLGQRRNRRRLEQAADAKLDIEARPDAADQPHRQQGMPAQLKEIVVNADPGKPENLGKQRTQQLLLRRARRTQHLRRNLRLRQSPPVQLAVGRERKRIENHKGRRHHVVRQ